MTVPELARHGGATLLVCLLIAAVLTVAGAGRWDVNLVYSISIGMLSWLSIELGRLYFASRLGSPWPPGWRGLAVVVAGMVIGLGVGSWIGQRYLTYVQPEGERDRAIAWLLPILITVITSAVMSLVFYLIGKSRHLALHAAQVERQAAEAQLKLLQTQLEPHMLFNTLANLRVLIGVDAERAQVMLDHLIDYLRATLAHSRVAEHSLQQEFSRLEDYLALMQIRMGARLGFVLELPEPLTDVPVPPLLLQPLVENSIRHGLEPKVEGGKVTVTARPMATDAGAFVELTVQDNGLGLAGPPPGAQGFGTAQVRERLATLYGDAASFDLCALPDGSGTVAKIKIPRRRAA